MKHHLCWHNEQEFSAQNDDFLPAHIWHNLVLDASHHVTVMGPRLKSEQQRTYLCRYKILSLGERRHCATQSYRHHFYRMYNFILFVCMSFTFLALFIFVPYKKTCSFRSIVSSSPAANYPFSPQKKTTCGTHSNLRRHFPKLSSFWPLKVHFFLLLLKNTSLPLEPDWINRPSAPTSRTLVFRLGVAGGWGVTHRKWLGGRAGPLHFCSCSKLRPAASFGSFRSSCHFSPSTVLSNQSAVRPSADAPPHVQVWNLFFPIQAPSLYCEL